MNSEALFQDEEVQQLAFTQGVRRKIVNSLFKEDKLPGDPVEQATLMKALEGMDRQVLSRAKIRTDDKTGQTAKQTTSLIAELLMRTSPAGQVRPENAPPRVLTVDTPAPTLVPGMTDVGTVDLQSKDILVDE